MSEVGRYGVTWYYFAGREGGSVHTKSFRVHLVA